jgi:YesN/AraC family two-component response regulator
MNERIDINLVLENSKDLVVLYVEDEPDIRAQTLELFKRFFKYVDVATDGEEGLKLYDHYYDRNGVYYDLVITDIRMPNMDGIAMSKAIVEKVYNQFIVVVSAHSEFEHLFELINIGVNCFLPKPINIDLFMLHIHRIAQNISDRKMGQLYYQNLENHHIELSRVNDELKEALEEKEKALRLLDTNVIPTAVNYTYV